MILDEGMGEDTLRAAYMKLVSRQFLLLLRYALQALHGHIFHDALAAISPIPLLPFSPLKPSFPNEL